MIRVAIGLVRVSITLSPLVLRGSPKPKRGVALCFDPSLESTDPGSRFSDCLLQAWPRALLSRASCVAPSRWVRCGASGR